MDHITVSLLLAKFENLMFLLFIFHFPSCFLSPFPCSLFFFYVCFLPQGAILHKMAELASVE